MGEGLAFWISVTPRARREAVGGLQGDALRVSVTAPPVGGKANAACVQALAEAFGVGRRDVEINPGARGRRKRVRLSGETRALEERLQMLARTPRLG
jgi:uncharacterized protein (TIGR00251 family)